MKGNVSLGLLIAVLLVVVGSSLGLVITSSASSVLSASDFSVFGRIISSVKQEISEKKQLQTKNLDNEFSSVIAKIKQTQGEFSVYILDTLSNKTYEYNSQKEYYAASLFKLIVAQATYSKIKSGELSLDTKVKLLGQDYASGTGVLNSQAVDTEYTIEYVLDRLLKDSDNTAQNILLRYVTNNNLNSEFKTLDPGSSFLSQNIASPKEVSIFMQNAHPEVFAKMQTTSFDDRVNLGLASDITFAHKIGNWNSSWHDCGLATKNNHKVFVCVMSDKTSLDNFKIVSKNVGEFVSLLFN